MTSELLSTSGTLSNATIDALGQLREVLVEAAWPQLYLHVARGELFATDLARARREIASLDEDERLLLELFGLGERVDATRLVARAPWCTALVRGGLLQAEATTLKTSGYVIVPVLGGMLLCGTPSTYTRGTNLGAKAYLGNDSLRLAGLLGPIKSKSVLDLGAGCGIQGLLAARGAREAVLSDIDPTSLKICALNQVLNEVEHPVRLLEGDLYAPVAGERFDVVVVLPPYVPVDTGIVSLTAAGGRDGLKFIRRLLLGAPDVLEPGGELVMFAQLLCNNETPLLSRELDELASGLDTTLTLYDHHRLQPYALELAGRITAGGDLKATMLEIERDLRAVGADGVCTAAIRARRPLNEATKRLRRQSSSPSLSKDDHLVLRGDVNVARADGYVVGAMGATRYLDPATFALVAALEADRSLVMATELAWGQAFVAAPEAVIEQAIERLAPLVHEGIIEQVGD